jgi:hypothetical protein
MNNSEGSDEREVVVVNTERRRSLPEQNVDSE